MTRQEKLTYASQARAIMQREGMRQADAARLLGLTPVQLTRALQLDPAAAVTSTAAPIGRPATVPLTANDVILLRRHRLNNKIHSLAAAVDSFLDDPEASEPAVRALSAIISKAHAERKVVVWPFSVRKAAVLTASEKENHRGPKHAFQVASRSRSGAFVRIGDKDIPLLSGMIYVSDDMSLNQPYRFWDSSLARETVGRQSLMTRDVRSLCWLQADACGRERDAYRLEDIADHMRNVVETHGLPLAWVVERGPWKNTFIDGLRLEDGTRWGALNDLFHIHHAFVSTGKTEIEGGFGPLQSLLSHKSTDIGAHRGEFETATKLMAKANRGDPESLRYFWSMSECMNGVAEVMQVDNNRLKQRQHLNGRTVSPQELWSDEYVKTELHPEDAWYFLPVKMSATVRGGMIVVKTDHYERTFRFQVHGSEGMPCLDHLYPVLIAFHPGKPEEGCHVFNNCSDHRNREGYAFGQKIGIAEFDPDVPKLVIGAPADVENKKKRNAAVRAEYRTIIPAGTGPGTLKSVARDGLGQALEIQRGGSVPDMSAEARPAPREAPAAPVRGGLSAPVSRGPSVPSARPNDAAALFGSDRAARLAALEAEAAKHL
jgi:hypothetical protein